MKSKKLMLLLLVITIITAIMISCAEKSGDKNPTENGSKTDIKDPDVTDNLSHLPNTKYDGYTFTFMAFPVPDNDGDMPLEAPLELVAEVENDPEKLSDPIISAVFERNEKIMEKFNVKFDMKRVATDIYTDLTNIVNSDDATYDAVIIPGNAIQTVVKGALLTNISKLTYIDLDNPWWDDGVKSVSINNQHYLLGGDMLILDNEATNALLFNKKLMQNDGMDFPYALVKEGKWTLDEFNKYIKDAAKDMNGDNAIKYKDDRYGFVSFNDTLLALFVGGGANLARKDSDDLPYITFNEARNINVYQKVIDIMKSKDYNLNVQQGIASAEWNTVFYGTFEEDRALFQWVRMRAVEKFRGMESEFGIIPLPKYDELQENYYSLVNPYTSMLLGVPRSAKDLDRISVILEALAAESGELQHAYYDIALQRKHARDEESREMLDIIFNSRVYDVGAVYGFGDMANAFIGLCSNPKSDITSFYDKNQGKINRAINDVVAVFQDME